jgi:hypothetical protein
MFWAPTLLAVPCYEVELTKLSYKVLAPIINFAGLHARFLGLSMLEEAVPQLWRGGG